MATALNEKSFSRLMRNMQNKTVGLISAYRANLSGKENEANQKELKSEVKKLGLGYNEITGHYVEAGEQEAKPERTLVIYTDNDKEWLKKFLLKMSKRFNQDSFIIVDKENGAYLIGGSGNDEDLPSGEEISLGQFSASKLGQAYSKMGKDTFVFEELSPDTLAMAYYINKVKQENNIMEELLNEEFEPDAAAALADYLEEEDPEDIESLSYDLYGIPEYSYGSQEWAVTDDYDAVEYAAKESVASLIDELGAESLNWDNMGGIENYLNDSWFEEAMRESYEFYADDIESESASSDEYENRLEEEMAEAGVSSKEEFVDKIVEDNMNSYGSAVGWYIGEYGNGSLNDLLREGAVSIDTEKAAEEVISTDGVGHVLATYDGELIEHDYDGRTYYMLRLN